MIIIITIIIIIRQATLITGEPTESTIFQQLSVALQRGNAATFLNTFVSD